MSILKAKSPAHISDELSRRLKKQFALKSANWEANGPGRYPSAAAHHSHEHFWYFHPGATARPEEKP